MIVSKRHQTEYKLWFHLHEILEMIVLIYTDRNLNSCCLGGVGETEWEEASITESFGVIDML